MTKRVTKKVTGKQNNLNNRLFSGVIIAVIVVGSIVALLANLINTNVVHQGTALTDKYAANAAVYIDDETGIETSTSDLAYKVVGSKGDTTIGALEASGTNFSGTVILRIHATANEGQFGEDEATNCYEYDFQKYTQVVESRLRSCPNKPVLNLLTPKPNTYNPKTAP